MSGIPCGKSGCRCEATYCVEIDLDGELWIRGGRLLGAAEATLCGRHLGSYVKTRTDQGFRVCRVESLEDEP